MLRGVLVAVALISGISLAGCSATPHAQPGTAASSPTPCADSPELTTAIDTLLRASNEPGSVEVFGEAGGRTSNLFALMQRGDLAAMQNPKGAGVIVSLVYAGDHVFARSTAHRAGWLILDGAIYPIDVNAAQAFGLLWDGYPEPIKTSAGLGQDYFGMDSYGLEDFVSYNADTVAEFTDFLTEANELCESPTLWG